MKIAFANLIVTAQKSCLRYNKTQFLAIKQPYFLRKKTRAYDKKVSGARSQPNTNLPLIFSYKNEAKIASSREA